MKLFYSARYRYLATYPQYLILKNFLGQDMERKAPAETLEGPFTLGSKLFWIIAQPLLYFI